MHMILLYLAMVATGVLLFGTYRYFRLSSEQAQVRKKTGWVAIAAAAVCGLSLVVATQINPNMASFATGVFGAGVVCVGLGALFGRLRRPRVAVTD